MRRTDLGVLANNLLHLVVSESIVPSTVHAIQGGRQAALPIVR
jgi:hypothetical protein